LSRCFIAACRTSARPWRASSRVALIMTCCSSSLLLLLLLLLGGWLVPWGGGGGDTRRGSGCHVPWCRPIRAVAHPSTRCGNRCTNRGTSREASLRVATLPAGGWMQPWCGAVLRCGWAGRRGATCVCNCELLVPPTFPIQHALHSKCHFIFLFCLPTFYRSYCYDTLELLQLVVAWRICV